MYEVHVACEFDCEAWEEPRVMSETDDADEAIRRSSNHRDQTHTSWVEKKESTNV
jgi:hypothetical protein